MFSMISAGSGRDGGFHDRRSGCGGLPAGGKQGSEIVLVGHSGDASENVGEIGFRRMPVTAGAFHQGTAKK